MPPTFTDSLEQFSSFLGLNYMHACWFDLSDNTEKNNRSCYPITSLVGLQLFKFIFHVLLTEIENQEAKIDREMFLRNENKLMGDLRVSIHLLLSVLSIGSILQRLLRYWRSSLEARHSMVYSKIKNVLKRRTTYITFSWF